MKLLQQYCHEKAIREIRSLVAKHAGEAKLKPEEISVVAAPPAQNAPQPHFSTPACFSLARELKKSPHEIAGELAKKINSAKKQMRFVESAHADKGYLNFIASKKFFELSLAEPLKLAGKYGSGKQGGGKTFAVEYSDPNVGKPFHVGHIRSTILGSSIGRLRKFSGWKVFQYPYLGDAGTQVAKLVVALDEFKGMSKARDEKELLKYYVKMHEETQKRPELEEKARGALQLIEAGDEAMLAKIEEIRKISLRGFHKNWKRLGVEFDEITGESMFLQPAREIVSECLRKGIASRDENSSVVLELEQYGIPNTIIVRSNGTTLYLTRDFAREEYIHNKTLYEQSLIITASDHKTHFRQLYKTLELLGRPYAAKCRHVGFGLVFLESGKISSREGRVVFLEDVLNEAAELAKKEIASRELGYPEKEVNKIAETVGVGSVKFAFLRVGNEKNITFDAARATRFDGDTGAYLQYTCVRAKNILRKAVEEKIIENPKKMIAPKHGDFNEVEEKLLLQLAEFPEVVRRASETFQPHSLCEYLLKLASQFSEFYEKCPVLKAEGGEKEVSKRLAIVRATQTTLENGLGLLGISVPERM